MKNLNLSGQTRWLRGVALAIGNAKMRVNPRMTPTSTACDLGFTLLRMCAVFCILFTIGVGNVWGGKITLTQSSLELTGSYTSGTEKTVDGVTFVYTNLMKNNDNIQAKASTGVIYNKTAMPGNITEIKVTHSGTARSTTVFYGTSSQPTTNETIFSGSKTISVSGSNKYFKITRGDNAAYWTSIEITYADAVAYTITATRNNDSYGTVSVTGTTITATPNSGYRVMSGTDGYTVTSGTATVVNNGDNTFTVTPSSNCTVRINFESKGCSDHYGTNVISGSSTDDDYGPVCAYNDYSTRQILYTRTDLGLAAGKKGTIKSIYFEYAGAAAMAARTIKIYMANTALTALSTSAFVPYSSFSEVYSGTFSCASAGWYEITLDTPFDYNGFGNLVVLIDDNTDSWESSKNFKYHTANTTTGAQIYYNNDGSNENPATTDWSTYTATNNRPNTKFCIQEADMVPSTVTLMDNGAELTEASAGAGVTLPSRAGCTDYTFAGWTKTWTEEQDEWTTTAPTIIPAGSYTPSANENLYPVYTKTEGGVPVETKTQTFQYDTWTKGGSSTDKSSYRLFHNGGYVESASNVDFSKLSKVIVYGGTFGGGSYNGISIKKADGTLWKNATVSGSDQTGTNTITGGASLTGSAKLRVYSTSGTASGTGVRISKVEVYTMEGGTTTYYISEANCCSLQAATSVTVTSVAETSVTLGWTAPSPTTGITKLQVVDGNGTVKVDNLAANATSATVTGLEECESYTFHVVSVGASCNVSSTSVPAQPFSGAKTVTYNYHEGTGSPASFTTACGNSSATLPTPTRSGYRFDGWYDAATSGSLVGAGGASYTPSANITLHAYWTQVYTVTYNYAGGSGSCEGGSYAAGETVTTCATATKAGSTLTGWTRSDNSTTVTNGNTFTMPASNVTLTAVWADTPYTLTQTLSSHITKGYTTTTIKSGDLTSGGLDMTYTISDNSYALPKAVTISGGGQTWTLGTNYTWTLSADKHSATLHIETDLTISADMTVTVSEQARYTVIWDEHGSTTTEYYAADDNTVTLKTGIADCGEKKFYGWTEDAVFTTNATTPPTMASSGAISGNKHYYAIYADAAVPANPGYNKITSYSNIVDGGTYLIVAPDVDYNSSGWHYEQYAYAGDNGNSKGAPVAVTFANDAETSITTKPASAKEVELHLVSGQSNQFTLNYDDSHYLKADNGNNLYHASFVDNDGAFIWNISSTEGHVGAIQSYAYSSRYLSSNKSNSGTGNFACYGGTQADAYLYLKETTTYSNFAKTCTLYDISIAATSDGTVTTTPSAGTGAAGEGQTVTVNVTPNSCKYLSALKYNDGSDHTISIASTPYTFTMPASAVTVTATFADKSVTSIAVNTSSHRTLMESTAFVGEQIRVTYNNGETEDLAWDDASLTFSGYNMSTLGNQTVSVAYAGSCGSANTSYSIEITDGIPVTFSDCGITTVNKYDPGDVVPVESTNGAYACSGWEFAGWSESSVAANSTSFTPVRNFNASTARTLYAVYAHIRKDGSSNDLYESADMIADLQEGARYVIAYLANNNNGISDGLQGMLPTVNSTNYLSGTSSFAGTEDRNADNSYVYHSTATIAANAHWQLMSDGTGYWQLYNKTANKYLDLSGHTNGYIAVSNSPIGKLVISNYNESVGDNNSQIQIKYNGCSDPHYVSWNRSSAYFNQFSSGKVFMLTKDEYFSSTPPCAPRSVEFHGNGGMVSDGVNEAGDLTITEASRDAGITTPVATYSDCSGKTWTFAGWLDHEADVSRVPIQTTDLLNNGGGNKPHTITEDDEEYWAVYSSQGEAQTKYGDIPFSMSDFSGNYVDSEQTVTKTIAGMGSYDFGYKRIGHASNIGIQFENGTGEFYNKTALGKINSISFTSFSTGGVNNLKVYVGDTEKATTHELTAEELQVDGSTYTYYPTSDCEYVYIKDYNSYVCVDGISIEFGKGTVVYSTTPDCKRITLSGEIYATSRNGIGIMTATPLRVNTYNLDANANVVITSNSSDVYFTTAKNANFAMAAANQPKNSVTVTAGVDGNLSTDVYIHYKPSSTGDGNPATVTVSAAPATPDPSVSTATHDIHVRNLSDKIVIAAKVGGAYYALPANMSGATNPSGVLIDVDEATMTATAPENCTYKIWPVKTVNPNSSTYDRYTANATYSGNAYGDRVRFSAVNNTTANAGLWANNEASGTKINNSAAIAAISDGGTLTNTNPSYEWKITTTVSDGKWSHTLQTDQPNNAQYLRYWTAATGGPKWGTYASGENNLYLLPVTEVGDATITAMEWGTDAMVVSYPNGGNCTAMTAKIGSNSPTDVTMTSLGGDIYKLTSIGTLQDNPAKALTLRVTESGNLKQAVMTVPLIVTAEKTEANLRSYAGGGTGADKLTEGGEIAKQTDVVIRDGGVLTTGTASGVFKDLYIYPGGKAKITNNFKAANIYMRGGYSFLDNKETYKYPDLYVSGATITTSGVTYDLYVDNRLYYMFSMPYDVALSGVTDETGSEDFDVWVKHYNGATRATGTKVTGWEWYGDDAETQHSFFAGVGYEITAKPRVSGRPLAILRFPVQSGNVTSDASNSPSITVTNHGKAAYDAGTLQANNVGWNFIGNPYKTAYKATSDTSMIVDKGFVQHMVNGVWDGTYDWTGASGVRYITVPYDTENDYHHERVADYEIPAFSTFFIQTTSSGTFHMGGAQVAASIAPRFGKAPQTPKETSVDITLSGEGEKVTGKAGLVISEMYAGGLKDFEDVEQWFVDNNQLKTYMLIDGTALAYNLTNEQAVEQAIPMGYIATIAGEHTYSINETNDVSRLAHLWLTDHDAGITTDLLVRDYTFITDVGRYDERFSITTVMEQEDIYTDISSPHDTDWAANIGVYSDGKTLTLRGLPEDSKVYVYDMTGKLMASGEQQNSMVALEVAAQGVYNIRVVNGQDAVTLRSVIR